jgi:hypothetical protein
MLGFFQESGQISVTDYVRVTSTEWYVLTVILCLFSIYLWILLFSFRDKKDKV